MRQIFLTGIISLSLIFTVAFAGCKDLFDLVDGSQTGQNSESGQNDNANQNDDDNQNNDNNQNNDTGQNDDANQNNDAGQNGEWIPGQNDFSNIKTTDIPQGEYYDPYQNDGNYNATYYPFTMSAARDQLVVNIWESGNGISGIYPQTYNKESGSDGSNLLIGTWRKGTSEELLIITSDKLRWERTDAIYEFDYQVSNSVLSLGNQTRVPTEEELAIVAGWNKAAEAAFRSERSWIPATSTIGPPTIGDWGLDYHIVDHPDKTFVNDPEVIGTWGVVDFVDDYTGYDPDDPQWPDANTWSGLKFEADGVLQEQYNGGNWYSGRKWTKGIVIGESQASEYVIQNHPQGSYLFVQWKSGDYSARGRKPSYYVFKKEAASQ
jgi:hypothetical protein